MCYICLGLAAWFKTNDDDSRMFDDDDINREMRNTFVRTKVLLCRFDCLWQWRECCLNPDSWAYITQYCAHLS